MGAFNKHYRKDILAKKKNPSLQLTTNGLHSFKTEKHDKMIFSTDNDEDIFDSVF